MVNQLSKKPFKMPSIKYLVLPNIIPSKHDNDKHYITADMLIELYKVNPKECICIRQTKDLLSYTQDYIDSLIILRPKYNGNYAIPKV